MMVWFVLWLYETLVVRMAFKVVSNLGGSRVPRNEGSCAEEFDRIRLMIVLMRSGYWIAVSVLTSLCESRTISCSPYFVIALAVPFNCDSSIRIFDGASPTV